jgi:hydrogenase maturation protein HypF
MEGAEIRVRGRVQGVGFRPAIWRLANDLGLAGEVWNDPDGVLIRVTGDTGAIEALLDRIRQDPPPLARIERIERHRTATMPSPGFRIVSNTAGAARTQITPDASVCAACAKEVLDPTDRRYRHGFANCTHCGPRFSIICNIPYDRSTTTMAQFSLCDACRREFRDPADRRFHAQDIACPECGPRFRLLPPVPSRDPIEGAALLLRSGQIVAVKGIGGYQLACDATDAGVVMRLRAAKHRETKPFALMARDLAVIRRYCVVSGDEERLLAGAEAPIVLLRAGRRTLPAAIAPGLDMLGFMLPNTPLHLLLLHDIDRPVVMTSGNITDEPQIVDDEEALARLGEISAGVLAHDRMIVTRVDDSVVRMMGAAPRMLRRGRGYAPGAIPLPPGFDAAPALLAVGGEVKATFCLVSDGEAILSQHIGDLEDAHVFDDYRRGIAHYAAVFNHSPSAVAADLHPEYLSSKYARETGLTLIEVQHHHAHVAACLAENNRPLDAPPVLGVVLDGLGWGEDGTIWGGEFLLADYRLARRVATFKPVAMPGGTAAVREPWRNLYAHLMAAGLQPEHPHPLIEAMIQNGINSPLSSSCGRLFDAMAAALGVCCDQQQYEGEAAARLEAMAGVAPNEDDACAYLMQLSNTPISDNAGRSCRVACIDPGPLWQAVLRDLTRGTERETMAARFHKGLAIATTAMVLSLAEHMPFDTVALSGGCFQNLILFEQTDRRLREAGFAVLSHRTVPTNDGGLALGQAAVAAARLIA